MTYTYTVLDVTPMAFVEIRRRLEAAGYEHAFHDDVIDMHGIALKSLAKASAPTDIVIGTLLSHRTKQGVVELAVNGERIQMNLDKAREVLGMLSQAIEAAISDQLLHEFLRVKVGLDENKASMALLDFREMRHGTRDVVSPS